MTPRLLTASFLAVACPVTAAPIPADAKAPPLYFPTVVGAKWVYERGLGASETVVVASVEKVGNDMVISRAGADGTTIVYAKVVVSPAGLRQDRDVTTGQLGEVWLLKTPFRSGESWVIPVEVGGGRRTVSGPDRVDVPAGQFLAAKVVYERGGSQLTSWYAPGVGEVKRVERLADGTETVTRSLRSFTQGNTHTGRRLPDAGDVV
ncbi:hypothetical protein J0H58_00890 [bacterium]|nr:hypothetical protein [bacterium]